MASFHYQASEDELELARAILYQREHSDALSLESAIRLFNDCELSLMHLRAIWPLVDIDRKGYLTQRELASALRLIGWLQAGHSPTGGLLEKKSPLPVLKGISPPVCSSTSTNLFTTVPFCSPKPPFEDEVITPGNSAATRRFSRIFPHEGPIDGILSRRQILEIFISQSDLSVRNLAQVIDLFDVDKRDGLDIQQFCLAMHVAEALDTGSLSTVLPMVPLEIHEELQKLQNSIASIASIASPQPMLPSEGHAEALHQFVLESFQIPGSKPDNAAVQPIRLSDQAELDLNFLRLEMNQKGCISAEVQSRFRWRYNVQPSEMNQIWKSVPGYDCTPMSASAIEGVVRLVRARLRSSQTAQLRIPRVPDRLVRSASPPLSECSSYTDEATPYHDELQEDVRALRVTLQALDSKVAQPQSFTEEIRRLARALAQAELQRDEARASAEKFMQEADTLRQLLNERNVELAEVGKLARKEIQTEGLVSTPDMRALFLKASLRKAHAEVARGKAEIKTLKQAALLREQQYSERHAGAVGCEPLEGSKCTVALDCGQKKTSLASSPMKSHSADEWTHLVPPPAYPPAPTYEARQAKQIRSAHRPMEENVAPEITHKTAVRLSGWYEHEIGRLRGECEDAERLTRDIQAKSETRKASIRIYLATARATKAETESLRSVVKLQMQQIDELGRRLECIGEPAEMVR